MRRILQLETQVEGKTLESLQINEDMVALLFTDGSALLLHAEACADLDGECEIEIWQHKLRAIEARDLGLLGVDEFQVVFDAETQVLEEQRERKERKQYEELRAKFDRR